MHDADDIEGLSAEGEVFGERNDRRRDELLMGGTAGDEAGGVS